MKKIVDTIAQRIAHKAFSPVVYMIEHNGRIDFVYVSDKEISEDALYDIQISASSMLDCDVDILDIRYFSDFDKITLMKRSKVVYCENPSLPKILESRAVEVLKGVIEEKNSMLERKAMYGCYYLQ